MMKFNIEVAKLRKWINDHRDIENEFGVTEEEAFKLWNEPGLQLIGQNELRLLGYNEEKVA